MAFGKSRGASSSPGLFWMAALVFLVAGALIVALLYITISGPSEVERSRNWEVDESSIIEWMAKSIEAEESFRREYKRNPDHPSVYDSLTAAMGYQRKLKVLDPENSFGSVTRLETLFELLEKTKGKALHAIIRRNGENAADLVAKGDSISVIPLLEEALANQEWINTNLKGSVLVDVGEIVRLRQWLADLQSVDAVAEVEDLVEQATSAYATREWNQADKLFDRALEVQESINLNMPDSTHARWRLVQELNDYKRRIEAGRMNQRIEELLNSSGQSSESDNKLMAMNLQGLLNDRYGSTEFANSERFESLKKTLASDRSQGSAALLQQQSDNLARHIRNHEWAFARAAILELEGSVKEFVHLYSAALLPDNKLENQIAWLIEVEPQLEWFSGNVGKRLIRHPHLDVRFLVTEVDQQLYETVMGSNPSRWVGLDLPVDSVSYLDAQLFCQRMGWALGREVVLPRVNWLEFLGKLKVDQEGFWFSHNSGFVSKPVGSSNPVLGLHDILGNLEEWVVDMDGVQVVGLFGGSGADSANRVQSEPLNRVAENFRSRWAGFRFCIMGDSLLPSPTSN